MEPDFEDLSLLFPNLAAQLRNTLSTMHLAASQLAPSRQREQDPALDAKAALLDQSYYQLLRLANNLSDAALLRQQGPLALKDTDLVELVGEICRRTEPLAAELGLTLRFACRMERHVCAAAPRELERLLYHLLSNAFKFTPSGGTVTVELKTAAGQVLLSVEDTGRGIEPERLETLFDRCLHESLMDPRPHGLGLGLALCRAIAQGHGGSIMAQSRQGRGSRVTVSLPDRRAENGTVSDVPLDYTGGFNRTLLYLADALPSSVFLVRYQG